MGLSTPPPANGDRPALNSCSLVITDLGVAPYQTWSHTRSGHLYNIALAAGLTEQCGLDGGVLGRFALSDLWLAEAVSASEMAAIGASLASRIPPPKQIDPAGQSKGQPAYGLPPHDFILLADLRNVRPDSLPAHEEMAVSVEYAGGSDPDGQKVIMRRLSNGPHQVWYADTDGRIISRLKRDGRRDLCLTRTDEGLTLAAIDPVQGKNQFWRYELENRLLVWRDEDQVMALRTPHCTVSTDVVQTLRTEPRGGGGFKAFRLAFPTDDVYLPSFEVAKTRSWLLRQTFGGGHGCHVVISNESGRAVVVKDCQALKGDFAGAPPASIQPGQGLPGQGRLVAAYVYNRVGREDAVGWLSFAGEGSEDRADIVFGVPNSGSNRAQVFAHDGKPFDRAALFKIWDDMRRTPVTDQLTVGVFNIAYRFDESRSDFPTITIVIRDKG